MRAAMNTENVDIPPNHDLSDIDKAYTAINYPRDLPSVLKALETIDLDSNTTLAIIEAYNAHDVLEMRRLLAEPSSSLSGRCPFFGTSHLVVAISRTIRRLPASIANCLRKSYCICDNVQEDDLEVPLFSRDDQTIENGFDLLPIPKKVFLSSRQLPNL
jgi:hypothetical protein